MTVPTFDEIMFPLLDKIKDGGSYKASDISQEIENNYFTLTEDEKRIRLKNGRTKFYDRLLWARTYLKKAGLVEYPKTGCLVITQEGKKVLDSGIDRIDTKFLKRYDSFGDFVGGKNSSKEDSSLSDLSPRDLIDSGYNKINSELEQEILEKLKKMNPYLFEVVALKLLNSMGYGDFEETPKSGDGGIDGIINQDELGLEKIYIQCKRFNSNAVREPDIRNFIGAMSSDVNKGVFVTTSYFESAAVEKARMALQKIRLIDGEELAKLMVKFNVGTQVKEVYEVKELDADFFDE